METNSEKFNIELTKEQLKLLMVATEKVQRLICGQLDIGLQCFCEEAFERHNKNGKIGTPEWYNMRDEVERHINELRQLCWKQGDRAYYGIHYNKNSDNLWDMYQVMRHALWLDTPEDKRSNMTVDSNKPMHTGNEPLIKISKIN